MTHDWDNRAARLQERVIDDDSKDYRYHDEQAVRRAIIKVREDIVLLVSYLSSANTQLSTIKILLLIVVMALAYIGYRLTP